MNWVKSSDAAKMLKSEIRAQTGKTVNVRKNQYGNIEVDCSKYPHLRAKIDEIVSRWRSGSMGMFDNFERNAMYLCVNPESGCKAIWNEYAVRNNFLSEMAERVNVTYDYISVFGGSWY